MELVSFSFFSLRDALYITFTVYGFFPICEPYFFIFFILIFLYLQSVTGQQPSQSHSPSQYHSQPSPHSITRVTLPPTPPMRPDSVFEGSTNSPTLPAQTPSYFYSPSSSHRNSYPPVQQKSPVYSSPESPYPPPHQSSYYPPPPPPPPSQQQQQQQQSASSPSMGYGKSLPPHPHIIPVSVAPPSASNPWHHHHHSSPASHAAFPQSQDRYICQTCNKAFSRPSSLRIHSHSHTGEKPFKCPHHGCGKAFSVRSNMKRHERGCHQ